MKRSRLRKLLSKARDRAEDVLSFLVEPLETLNSREDKRKKDRRNGL